MSDNHNLPFDRKVCRETINRLKDGEPPPFESIEFLSIGYQSHLEQAKGGLNITSKGGYSAILLEGDYGIGKSHLLNLIEILAKQEKFIVKKVEVGTGGIYFNNPPRIYKQILGHEREPWASEYRSYGPYYNDYVHKFVAGLKILAERHRRQGASGLVILIDELENTFSSYNLPNFRARAKAYRLLDTLFRGGIEARERNEAGGLVFRQSLRLNHIHVVLAITPGTINRAIQDGPTIWGYNMENPAGNWKLPTRLNIKPLSYTEAIELSKRIRAIHSQAFTWEAKNHVPDNNTSDRIQVEIA